ncbi:hypothetical protein AVEN_237541-1 [Araneus ventricosus]|uniref:Uncharacterized protein n=1 Tax=Araneus ventricosus TaxID=182803 RepID=A0A4Y2MVP8_ARAVE|nr:hypothetical protein AVEN_237541-1 [Araneus ventricosus]
MASNLVLRVRFAVNSESSSGIKRSAYYSINKAATLCCCPWSNREVMIEFCKALLEKVEVTSFARTRCLRNDYSLHHQMKRTNGLKFSLVID